MPDRLASDKMLTLMTQLFLVLTGSALLAISAQFAVRLPLSPVPVTGQTLVVLMIGMAFGARLGAATVLAYLAEGAMGLPVFAEGKSGLIAFAGPTGGYLVGFVAAAFATGFLAERGMGRGAVSTVLAMIVGNIRDLRLWVRLSQQPHRHVEGLHLWGAAFPRWGHCQDHCGSRPDACRLVWRQPASSRR